MPEKVNRAEAKVMEECHEQFKDAVGGNSEWYYRAIESYRFYTGLQQWDEEILLQLAREGRPALTINKIFPYINLLWGFQSQNRNDIKLYPRRGGSVAMGALGSELIKHTIDASFGQDETSDAFADGLIGGKGWWGIDKSYENDPINGDLIVEKKSPFSIIEDQNNRHYSINKGMYLFETDWWDKGEIELQYPKKAKQLEEAVESPQFASDVYYPSPSDISDEDYQDRVSDTEDRRKKTQYRLRKRWYKKWEKCTFIIHIPTLTPQLLSKHKLDLINEKKLLEGLEGEFRLIERIAPVMYYSVSVGELLLEHVRDPFDGLCLFPRFRYCPYYIDGYILSPVDVCKEPQMEHNKRRSQALHHLNSTVNSGIIHGAVTDKTELEKLQQEGSKPGITIDESKLGGAGAVRRFEPATLDTAHLQLAEMAANDMKETWGINNSILETSPQPKESGRAKQARQQMGMMPSQKLYDNYARTEKEFGFTLWEFIRTSNIYSEEEIEAVVRESSLKPFVRPVLDPVSGQPTEQMEVDLSAMRSWKFGRYGVTVARSASLPSARAEEFENLTELAKGGFPIPPELIIEASDTLRQHKEEVNNYIRQKQAAAAQPPALPAGA